jgi:Icc-related predicted phosphoesterase
MKIVAISDTHGFHERLTSNANFPNNLPYGDLLIHAGDFSSTGKKGEVEDFAEWLQMVAPNYTHGVVFIAGNHDRSFDPKFNYDDETRKTKPTWVVDILSNIQSSGNIHYLENSSINVGGINIWGSPITPWFYGDRWAFNKHRGDDIREVWDTIPTDTDIIITHGPVAYKLDFTVYDKQYVGCEDLRKAVNFIKPKLHISGHIHEGYDVDYDEHTNYVNASICTLNYEPTNKPWEIELWDGEVLIK